MKYKLRKLVAQFLLILGVVMVLPLISVEDASAEDNEQESIHNPTITISNPPNTDLSNIPKLCDNINVSLNNDGLFTEEIKKTDGSKETKNCEFLACSVATNNSYISISVDMSRYKDLGQKARQTVMDTALSSIKNNEGVSTTNKNKLYNELCSLDESTSSLVRQLSTDVDADFAKAYATFRPFSGYVGWILGLISLAMFALLGITIVWDLAFLVIPFWQAFLIGDNNEKPKTVSIEAWNAVKKAESSAGKEYIEPIGVYFKSKSKQFIAIFICLLYLVSGEIYTLIAQFMDYFRGLVDIVK